MKMIEGPGDPDHREVTFEVFSQYLCRDWNSRHPADERLQRFGIFVLVERTDAPPGAPPERLLALRDRCRDESQPHAATE
jgi:hypothetical protein